MDTATAEPTSTTPAPATQTSTAAPATSEPSPSSAASQRPTSMLAAFEQVAAQEDASAASPASDATAPAVQGTPSTAQLEQAPPPEKWPTVLENARTKAISARDAQWMDKYGWATKIPEASLTRIAQVADEIRTNPIAHTVGMIQELFRHPTLGPQAKGAILQALGVSGNGRASQPLNFDPDVQIMDNAGNVTGGTYTAEKVKAIVQHAVAEAIGREVAPLKQDHQQRQQADRQHRLDTLQQQESQRVNEMADGVMGEIKELFGDHTELWGELAAAIQANPRASEVAEAMKLFRAKVLPTLHGQAKTEAIAHMKRSAQANTANGAGTTTAPMKRPTNEKELAEYMRNLDAGGAP